jgi:MFS family permease
VAEGPQQAVVGEAAQPGVDGIPGDAQGPRQGEDRRDVAGAGRVLLGVVQVAGMLGGLTVSLLAELAGERRCLLAGLAMASAGSACGAVAGSVTALLISRVIEGAGSVLTVVAGPGLIRRHTPPERLNTAIGYWGGFTGIAALAGLAGSAVMLHFVSWRVLWWVLTAVTVAPLPLVAAGLPPDEPRGTARHGGLARHPHRGLAGDLVDDLHVRRSGRPAQRVPERAAPGRRVRVRQRQPVTPLRVSGLMKPNK